MDDLRVPSLYETLSAKWFLEQVLKCIQRAIDPELPAHENVKLAQKFSRDVVFTGYVVL